MKSTVLYSQHKILEASFGDFGGYTMPLWYKSAKEEHLNVLTNVGLFDTSHMALFSVKGDDAFDLLQEAFTRDLHSIPFGKCVYGLFLNDSGFVVDDALIYVVELNNYMVVVNAGMSDKVINHLRGLNYSNYLVVDYSDKLGKIDVQGPLSIKLVEKIWGNELFDVFPYFSFKGSFLGGDITFKGEPILISRSGYTGEFGFELFVKKEIAEELWTTLMDEGAEFGAQPCGLAARDSLRVGAGLPLSHQDIGGWIFSNTPWQFAITTNKELFVGKNALVNGTSYTYPYVGFDLRKLHSGVTGDVFFDNKKIGSVLSCVTEVSLKREEGKILSLNSPELPEGSKVKGLVAGFIKCDIPVALGSLIILKDGKRELKVEVVDNIRGNRTARKSIKHIRSLK